MDPNEEETSRSAYLDALWEDFVLAQKPETLAAYIEHGGEIDALVREIIVRFLRDGPPRRRGGANSLRDVEVYTAVEAIRDKPVWEAMGAWLRWRGPFSADPPGDGQEPQVPERLTQAKARSIYVERSGKAIEDDALRKQYERGRKIIGPRRAGK